ncbi:MAG: LysR family transcriptional regulator [Bacteriovoracaceae bacterium]|nr:LysR family transcriptional regulator [Bacteriovoracaceae bacterium]
MQLLREEVLVFIEVAKTGSMSSAALNLNIKQPTVSKAIKKLESECGETLFSRGREGTRLTPAGLKLMEQTEVLLNQKTSKNNIQSLTLGCHSSIAMDLFPQFLPRLKRIFAQTEFRFIFLPSTEVTRKVSIGEIDLGLVINPVTRRQLIARPIKRDFVALWGKTEARNNPVLIHPDMLYAPHVKKQFKNEIWTMPDYEVIAEMCLSGFSGLLPAAVANRYKLNMLGKKLFDVELKIITHEDRFDKTTLKQFQNCLA